MLDIGWAELLVVGVVALLVVGPKELPGMLRTLGKYIGMVRRQANEFKAQFNDAIKDTEIDELRKEVDAIRNDTAATFRDVKSSVSVSDRDIAAPKPAPAVQADPTWKTDGTPPSPAETAAQAAAERAAALRTGTTAGAATAAVGSSAEVSLTDSAETAKPAVNGATRPHNIADAGA